MKVLISLIAIVLWNINLTCQETFIKKYPDPNMQDVHFTVLHQYSDTIYALVWVRNKTELWKIDDKGNVIVKKKFHWLIHYLVYTGGDKRMMFDSHGDILISGTYQNNHGLLKLNRNLDSLWFKSFALEEASFVTDVSMTETKDYIVLQGQAQYNFSPVFVAHLIWLDKEGNLDTMIVHKEVNEIGNIKQGRIKTDKDDNVVFVYGRLFHDPDFPLWGEVYKGVLKYDKKKKVIWEWESKEILDESFTQDFVFSSTGDIIFLDEGGVNTHARKPFLTCLGKDKSFLWRSKVPIPLTHEKYIYGVDNFGTNEIIIYGAHAFSNKNTQLTFHCYVSTFDESGTIKWERTYLDYMGEEFYEQQSSTRYFTFSLIFQSATFDNNHNIIFGGANTMIYPEVGRDEALLVKLDTNGCLNKDRCNEVNETEPIDFIRFYDQIPILQKNMIYARKNADGSSLTFAQTFGKDSIATDQRYGSFLFREVWYKNMDTGEKIKDYRKARYWYEEGKIHFATKNNPHPEHLLWTFQDLYNFTLETGNQFELPDSFGIATVISTDTFYLKDGAIRKRIVLRHNDETFHQTHGDLVWVEGIGNINGSFFYQDDWKSGQTTELLCYFDRNQKRYYSPNSVDCLLSSTNDENQDFSLIVFPNPVYHQISYISDQKLSKIEIIDITGRLLLSQNQDSGAVDVSLLSAGVYYLHFYTENGRFIAKKFLKL